MPPDELVDDLAAALYVAATRPIRYTWEEIGDRIQDSWRDAARCALRWVHEHTDPVDEVRGGVDLDELLGVDG
jgi:hypothetical protein